MIIGLKRDIYGTHTIDYMYGAYAVRDEVYLLQQIIEDVKHP